MCKTKPMYNKTIFGFDLLTEIFSQRPNISKLQLKTNAPLIQRIPHREVTEVTEVTNHETSTHQTRVL